MRLTLQCISSLSDSERKKLRNNLAQALKLPEEQVSDIPGCVTEGINSFICTVWDVSDPKLKVAGKPPLTGIELVLKRLISRTGVRDYTVKIHDARRKSFSDSPTAEEMPPRRSVSA